MERNDNGFIELKQVGITGQMLEALGLDTKLATTKWTPTEQDPFVKDVDEEGPEGSFSYSSVVEMLLYLSGYSQTDIAYAVNCCVRYMINPGLSHKKALKRICQVSQGNQRHGFDHETL